MTTRPMKSERTHLLAAEVSGSIHTRCGRVGYRVAHRPFVVEVLGGKTVVVYPEIERVTCGKCRQHLKRTP